MAVVVPDESEMAHRCALDGCERFESVETAPRFKRCSLCKRRYYVRASSGFLLDVRH